MSAPGRPRSTNPYLLAAEEFGAYYRAVNAGAPVHQAAAEILRTTYPEHVVIGAHARNAHLPLNPRATVDLDVILAPEKARAFAHSVRGIVVKPAVQETPGFIVIRQGGPRGQKVLDVGIASIHPLFERVLASEASEMEVPGLGRLRVATKEAAVVLKLFSATDPGRSVVGASQDETDALALLSEPPAIDRARVLELLALVPDPTRTRLDELERRLEGRK